MNDRKVVISAKNDAEAIEKIIVTLKKMGFPKTTKTIHMRFRKDPV